MKKSLDTILHKDNLISPKSINLPLRPKKRHLAFSRSVFTYEIFFNLLRVRVKLLL